MIQFRAPNVLPCSRNGMAVLRCAVAVAAASGLGGGTAHAQKLDPTKSKPAPRVSIERRGAITHDASVRIYGAISSLRIVGWERDSLVITGTMPAGWRFDGGMGSGVMGPSRGAKFYVDAGSDVYPAAAELEIRAPSRARLWAKSGSADIEVSGMSGGLDLNIVGGSITVAGTPRELNIESMDGNVRVQAGASWLRVKTATGAIDVRGGSEDAGLSTVSGTIHVADGRYERAKLETVTGDVDYAGEVGYKGSVDITTHSGKIDLRLPPKPNIELDAATVTGTIENGVTRSAPVPGREGRGMELGFSSGNGDTHVVVRSFKGNVALKPR
jgi:putative adhesin